MQLFHTPVFIGPIRGGGGIRVLPYCLVRKNKNGIATNGEKFDDMFSRFDRIPAQTDRNAAKACNFYTRALRHVSSLLTDDVAQTVACSIVASRLDYCNALLSGAPAASFDKLQCAQNNKARVVCQSRGRNDARPLLHSLHWLPARQRVTYKAAAVPTHKVRTTATPTYLSQLVQTHAPPRALHSSDARLSSHTHRSGPSRFFCCCSIHQ